VAVAVEEREALPALLEKRGVSARGRRLRRQRLVGGSWTVLWDSERLGHVKQQLVARLVRPLDPLDPLVFCAAVAVVGAGGARRWRRASRKDARHLLLKAGTPR